MHSILIKNGKIINEGKIYQSDIYIEDEIIKEISPSISLKLSDTLTIDAGGNYVIPGLIDDQVHFREPGLTHKGDIYTESRAAVAGGITSFLEMPNTIPQTITQDKLNEKFTIASKKSIANYSFMFGGTNDNINEILKLDPKEVPALKIFLGSSTGNMLVDNIDALEEIFLKCNLPIAVHCEDENTIRENLKLYTDLYGKKIPIKFHSKIRNEKACYLSSSMAIDLAKKTGARLHVFHVSTKKETDLFLNSIDLKDKKITAEVCIHHLTFTEDDYKKYGTRIKWNPSIKSSIDQDGLWKALNDDRIDIIATDHAPHTYEEKSNDYLNCPSGGPLVQHSLVTMLEGYHNNKIKLEKIVEKMCHNPAILYEIKNRGFIKEGYYADIVIFNLNNPWTVHKNNILYKCGWSPFEGNTFRSRISHTMVNGNIVFNNDMIFDKKLGQKLIFDR
ncbi:MAG TPA: dihydroorotase [Flavobacteriaceae bacterium]|nr:dihydroorotase [Flavobacteriaceae bacterium]|tara:strand:+ start:1406 stop:2746 length:1341 start_codon:yes stop_codon:yes gene_type:complete